MELQLLNNQWFLDPFYKILEMGTLSFRNIYIIYCIYELSLLYLITTCLKRCNIDMVENRTTKDEWDKFFISRHIMFSHAEKLY